MNPPESPPAAPANATADLTLGVVTTNYNTWSLAARCLEHVLPYSHGIDELLLVDDASSEPQTAVIDPRVRIVRNSVNLGLAATLNRALASLETDIVVIFDSDAYPLNDFTGPLRDLFRNEARLAAVGFATVDEDGRPTESAAPPPTVLRFILGPRVDAAMTHHPPGEDSADINLFSCAVALRRQTVLDLGGFDEAYDWLDLDHDLSMRLRSAAWALRYAPSLKAFHRGSGAPQRASARVLRHYQNRWHLLRKFGLVSHPVIAKWLVVCRLTIELVLASLLAWLPGTRSIEWRDRAAGRRAVLSYCLRHYR